MGGHDVPIGIAFINMVATEAQKPRKYVGDESDYNLVVIFMDGPGSVVEPVVVIFHNYNTSQHAGN